MKDGEKLYIIAKGQLVYVGYGACPDISVQSRLAKHLNETEKPKDPYFVMPIEFKDLSQR